MLRRLFISLLILSALASDGIIKLPANIYAFCLDGGNIADLPDNKPDELLIDEEQAAAATYAAKSSVSFVMSANSVSSFYTKAVCEGYCSGYKPVFDVFLCEDFYSVFYKSNHELVYSSSDSSPPYGVYICCNNLNDNVKELLQNI